jgi:hypothetical protein
MQVTGPDAPSSRRSMIAASTFISLCRRIAPVLLCVTAMPGCQTGRQNGAKPTDRELRQQLSQSQDLVRRYEARYGKLLPERPKHEFRKLRTELKGKSMSEVAALLGKPSEVYSTGPTESWDYINVAYDSASGRTVRILEVWFSKGVVDYVKAIF